MKWILLLVFLAAGPLLRADDANKVLCLGDSLTFGVGGDGMTWPAAFSKMSGMETVNQGNSGWIPRHEKYYFLLRDCDNLTKDELKTVPPVEMENRRYQPKINTKRSFVTEGQTVTVHDGGQWLSYRWDPNSTDDGPDVIKPNAVGDPNGKPPIPTGRWTPAGPADPMTVPATCVIWLGANGMDVDDVSASIKEILGCYEQDPARHYVVLGLLNRAYFSDAPTVALWGGLIQKCNDSLAAAYPGNYIDLQAWFTSQGAYAGKGFQTRDWFPNATDQDVANDKADQAAGVIPRSIRAPKASTHLNGTGYIAIASVVYHFMKEKNWLPAGTPAEPQIPTMPPATPTGP